MDKSKNKLSDFGEEYEGSLSEWMDEKKKNINECSVACDEPECDRHKPKRIEWVDDEYGCRNPVDTDPEKVFLLNKENKHLKEQIEEVKEYAGKYLEWHQIEEILEMFK